MSEAIILHSSFAMDTKNAPTPADKLTPNEAQQIKTKGAVTEPEHKPKVDTMRIDLHCHSLASWDSSSPLDEITKRCLEKSIRVQAITDHNCIWGAQEIQKNVFAQNMPLTIIVGEEISTTEGELIGLFLTQPIEAGLTPEQTIVEIKKQGGLVLLPHGFDPLKRWHLKAEALQRVAASIDIVETFNARISRPRWNRAAVTWANEHGRVMSAGSDAHTIADIGSGWVEVPARSIQSPADLMAALQGGIPMGVWTQPVIAFLFKMIDRTRRKLKI